MWRFCCKLSHKFLKESSRSNSASLTCGLASRSYEPGDVVHNYKVIRNVAVPDFFLTAIELQHTNTGSKHLHLARDDKNNVFNVLVRTTPMDSTGVAHILEHVVLCGSELFPVRDPFFKMLNRSMASFMNAMTGSDYTMYPFSTQNSKDYYNLMSVYLDSVFFPRIKEMDFLQEGWRLEHEITEDDSSPIVFKGVVFNEMKGYLADPSYIHSIALLSKILPDHTYSYNSGGDPIEIPKITWGDLKQFHKTHYHPSNASFITYGDIPLETHLKTIDENVMKKFTKINPDTGVPPANRWLIPRKAEIDCPPDKMAANQDRLSTLSVSYLLPEVSDVYENFIASVLGTLLTDGPSAPFYKSLIESGLGANYSPMTGYHSHQREGIFSVGLQGVSKEDTSKVEDIVLQTMKEAVKDGFPGERISAILHQMELSQKHQHGQFGLGVTFGIMPTWQHGADPVKSLEFSTCINRLQESLKEDPQYLQKKCQQYFVDNCHRLTLAMNADEKFKSKLEEAEKELLQDKVSKLNDDTKKSIYDQGIKLAEAQKFEEDLSCLPTLKVDDIPRKQTNYEVKIQKSGINTPTYLCPQPTNGVNYFRGIIPTNELDTELVPYLPLFCKVATEMGTKSTDYVEFSKKEEQLTGGLSFSAMSSPCHTDAMSSEIGISLSSHCLDRNTEDMFTLWSEIFQEVTFDNHGRLQTLIGQTAQRMANKVSMMGHALAMKSSAQNLSPSSFYSEKFGGLHQVDFMKNLAETKDVSDVVGKLERIATYALNQSIQNSRFCLVASPDHMATAEVRFERFLETLPHKTPVLSDSKTYFGPTTHWSNNVILPAPESIHHDLPMSVNFVSSSIGTNVPYSYSDNPSLRILARLMSSKFLHREIREIGGAYGSGAKIGNDGVFSFYSYRDPNTTKTLDTFKSSIQWAIDGCFTSQDIDEAKLAIFQGVDSPVSPCDRGYTYFATGIDDITRQRHRDGLLSVSREDIIQVANKYLLNSEKTGTAIIGPKSEAVHAEQTANS